MISVPVSGHEVWDGALDSLVSPLDPPRQEAFGHE